MVNDVTTTLKSRKNKLSLKLNDGCASVSRFRPTSISYLKSWEKINGSSSLPQTPTSSESSKVNTRIKGNVFGSEEELHSYQQLINQDFCKTKKPVLSDSFQQLKKMSEWTKLPTASSTVRWNDGQEARLSSIQQRRILMMCSVRNNLSLDSQKDSPEFQAAFTRFIYPSQVNKKVPSTFHQSDPGGLMNTTSPNATYKANVIESPLFSEAKMVSLSPEESWKTMEESTRVVVHRSANLNLQRQKRFHSSSRLES